MKFLAAIASFFIAAFLFFPSRVDATAQSSDILILDGKEHQLHTNPLKKYLEEHPNALPRPDVTISSNWRGYIATWEIMGDRLFLRKIMVNLNDPNAKKDQIRIIPKDVLKQVFPQGAEVAASWYSGALVVPIGKMTRYVHMGYASSYESYELLNIQAGAITSRRKMSAKQFSKYRNDQFQAYKLTDEYAKKFDDKAPDELMESFIYESESEHYLSIDFSKSP
jgi:hypothetical protein